MDDQRAKITEALREACEIVDEVLPRELLPRSRPAADRTELRKVALPIVLGVLLSLPGAPAAPDAAGPRDDDEVVGAARISELFDISPGTIRQWTALGILAPVTRGHHKLYRRSDVSRVVGMGPEERDALRKIPAPASGQDIDRMREDGLAWNEITSKTGLGRSALRTIHMKWLSGQREAAARNQHAGDPAGPGPDVAD